jgi:SAM-dependent methyltransferase
MVPGLRHYLAVFLLSLSLLMLEITVARILSVALLSHYAFVAISLAMFGLGLSALTVYLFPDHFRAEDLDRQLVSYSWRFGLAASLGVLAFLNMQVVQELSWRGFFSLSLAYGVLALPFFFGGVCIALLMTHFSSHIARVYYADLVGASVGCMAVVLAMQVGSAPVVALGIASVVSVATLAVALNGTPQRLLAPALTCLLVVGLFIAALLTPLAEMRYIKNWSQRYSDYEVWNAFSRLSAFDSEKFFGPGANAASVLPLKHDSKKYQGMPYPKTMVLDIDGAAWTPMMNFNGDYSTVQFLRESALYAVHHVKPNSDLLVIGVGGGRDLLAGLVFGQKSVSGIELNPLMRHIVEERYGDYSGRPYSRDGVQVIIDEARSRLSHLDRKFDIIQLSLIDTFSLNAAGGFVFSENFLYTKEAFREYFRHLNPDGVLNLTRYFIPAYPIEIVRLLGMARVAWAEEGIPDISRHVVVVNQGINATMLVKRSPFTAEELATVDALAAQHGMGTLYHPDRPNVGNPTVRTVITTPQLQEFFDTYEYIVEPATDDKPFFFNFLRSRNVDVSVDPFDFLRQWRDALSLIYLLIAVVSTMAFLFLVVPLFFLARRTTRHVSTAQAVPLLLYFACLGFGFMMIELPLLQRFVLFLGYPLYSLAVVLFALLLFSGTGSLLSSRFADPRAALPPVLIGIILLALVYAYGLPSLITALLSLSVPARIAITVLLLAPIGLLLGMAYPLGITILRQYGEGLVPWAWGLNGALSVVASVFAIFLGSRVGFTAALLTGIATYGVALVSMRIGGAAQVLAPEATTNNRGLKASA